MSFSSVAEVTETKNVGMGQVVVAGQPDCLTAVLGSCIGVAIYHERLRIGALAHVVLPESNGRTTTPGKFADTAIPYMLDLLKQRGAHAPVLVAKLIGGACMFGGKGPMQVGESNMQAVLKALQAAHVRVAAKDVGGNAGRRVLLDCQTGLLTVNTVGNPPRTL